MSTLETGGFPSDGRHIGRSLSKLGTIGLFLALCAGLLRECTYVTVLNHLSYVRRADDPGLDSVFSAVAQGQSERVASLLGCGVDVNGRDRGDYTPLMRAANSGRREICTLLIDRGADLNASTWLGWNALMFAVMGEDEAAVRLLLLRGAGVEASAGKGGRTALMVACVLGNPRLARILIDAGANVNAVAEDGTTALINAAASQSADAEELFRLLLECGADIHARDRDGKTALLEASDWAPPEVLALLLPAQTDSPSGR